MATSASLNVKVQSTGINTTNKKLKGLATVGAKTEKQTAKLQDKFKLFGKNAGAAVAAVDGPLGGVSSRLSSLITVATAGGAAVTGLAVSMTALTAVLSKGVSYLDDMNMALAKSEALIKATGGAAGLTADQLQEQSRQIALNTLASVQGIQQAQSVLLTFDNVSGSVFNSAIGLAQDMATVFGGTAASAATQLGKALQDPITGISALSRVGVTFNDQQKEQIKTLTKSGERIRAQSIIIETLKKQIGGVATAVASKTLAGSFDTLGQLFNEFTEQVAKNSGVLTTFQGVIDRIARGIAKTTDAIKPDTAAEAADKALDLLWEISEEEEALNKTRDKRSRNAIKNRIALLESEREELLSYASVVADAENKAAISRLNAAEKAEQIQTEKAKADRKALEEEVKLAEDKKKSLADADATGVSGSVITGAQTTLEQLDAKRNLILSYQTQELGDAAIHGEALKILDQQIFDERKAIADKAREEELTAQQETMDSYSGLASAASSMFSAFSDAASSSSDEMSDTYKAMWAISQGFAVAQASLNVSSALLSAFSDPSALTLPQKLANYAAIASATGSLVTTISGLSYSGRAQGGDTNPNGTYMVGERGPELVTFGREGGSVQSNSQSQQSSSASKTNYTVVNQTSGTINEVEQQNMTPNDVVLILKETMPGEISNANSGTRKALSRNTSTRGRLR